MKVSSARSCVSGKPGRLMAGLAVGALVTACAGSPANHTDPGAHPSPSPSAVTFAPQGSPPPSHPPPSSAGPLAGKTIGIDPGHNGQNGGDPAYIDHLIWNGREQETCDTTGTETDGGYTEAQFNFNVATYLRADLRRDGAHVVMTRTNNHSVGPCVTRRARILDAAHASVAIDIHADGGPPWGRGFTVLEPVADGINHRVVSSSDQFGADVRASFLAHTTMPESNYYGSQGLIARDDLAGLNLTTVPKVLIECGNMRNATDAALLTSPSYQRRIARALEDAIVTFITGH
ncbi:MAG TPA: N-acetylmuramoyl-L-alanine amidase [Streptosporangiaceae bacterium]|nr:N-acetylmuramoyl-L-alanine amidase [Streptosporangiaceae bacterium]